MDAPCKIQGSIHVFRLVNNMCPGKWVHIKLVSNQLVAIFNLLDISKSFLELEQACTKL